MKQLNNLRELAFVFVLATLMAVSSLSSYADQEPNSVLASFNSKIGLNNASVSSFTISSSHTVLLNEKGYFNSSSPLYTLYNYTNFVFRYTKPQGQSLALAMFQNITHVYLIPIIRAYEESMGSNYTSFIIVNFSVSESNGGYLIGVYYAINYSGFITVQDVHLVIWVNASMAEITITDPVSLAPVKGNLILPNQQIRESIIQKVNSSGTSWYDIEIQPVLYKENGYLIPVYKVTAYHPEGNGNALFLVAYVLPNMTFLSQQIYGNSYFGPIALNSGSSGGILFYYGVVLVVSLIASAVVLMKYGKLKLKSKP